MRSVYLNDCLARDANLFNAVRLVAAAAVIVSHAGSIKTGQMTEILDGMTPYALSDHAVNVFFALSGVLVAMSFDRAGTFVAFVQARLLRIFPAVIMCGLITAFVLGPALTSEPWQDYWGHADTWLYPLRLGIAMDENAALPGLFAYAPFTGEVNQPIWTLRWELAAYGGVALMGLAGFLRSRQAMIIMLVLAAAGLVADSLFREAKAQPDMLDNGLRYGMLYVLGAAAYVWRKQLPLSLPILLGLIGLTWLANNTNAELTLWLITTAYGALWAGSLNLAGLRRATDKGDISYGLYIYGWPVTQALTERLPDLDLPMLCLLSLVIAGALATLSWVYVEKPALDLKKKHS
jgi:peptidoglycan/LPS O-acetylase OafA/YrhL